MAQLSQSELPDIEEIIPIAQAGGDLVLEMQRRVGVRTKSTTIDLVTEADLACQELLLDRLSALNPAIGFWGEEGEGGRPDTDYFWLVDPIDGTVNYAHGLPWFAVNIALNRGEEILLGVTLSLPAGTVYWAVQGQGAFVRDASGRDERLAVSQADRVQNSLLSTGFPYHRAVNPDNNGLEFARIMPRCQGVRRTGSFALDVAHVAAGHLDAHWEGYFHPWDAAPGVLMIREAGGTVTNYAGEPWMTDHHTLVASNGHIHAELLADIQAARSALPGRFLQGSPK